jgi:hypothetical protein
VPVYPSALAEYGFTGRVDFRFVVDTLGRPELQDMGVLEATNEGFVEPARRAFAKCRYRPPTIGDGSLIHRTRRAVGSALLRRT